ncbi:MAG: hypothetical protein CFE33_06435 [Pseudorhodobacter sp. PARRP1]|nr:MAG: hypothetical protein CFE33_06435 [Pseudorhodobacter sp. PARRP1]
MCVKIGKRSLETFKIISVCFGEIASENEIFCRIAGNIAARIRHTPDHEAAFICSEIKNRFGARLHKVAMISCQPL